jgi:transposase
MDTSILGIDVAARKLDLVESNGNEHTVIENTPAALQAYLRQRQLVPTSCVVGLEATGDYHFAITRWLVEQGFTVKILNPIVTKRYTRSTVRGTKTDQSDAEHIVRLVEAGEGEPASLDSVANRDKELLRLSQMLTRERTNLLKRLQSLRRKNVGSTQRIEKKIKKIITALATLSDELVDEVTEERSRDEELIDSIPGFATKLSAVVHHELGDVRRFQNADSLVAFAGLDPRIIQSGARKAKSGRILKRGSPYLRSALFLAANVAYHYDPCLGAYYRKKKAEGRVHTEILCILSRKLLYRIWAVLKRGQPYQLRTV